MRTIIILTILVVLVGCSTVDSLKIIHNHPGALTQFPPGTKLTMSEWDEQGNPTYEFILPDGTFATVEGMPCLGNFTVVQNQNDGTSQTSRGQVQAEVSPALTGSGTASTTEGDAGLTGGTE